MNNISIIPIKNLPEFAPKHDLADEIIKSFSSNNFVIEDKDVIVITQKICNSGITKVKLHSMRLLNNVHTISFLGLLCKCEHPVLQSIHLVNIMITIR